MTDLRKQADMSDRTCNIEGCSNPVLVKSRGWCSKHYYAWKRHGDPLIIKNKGVYGLPPEERFWLKVDKSGPVPPYAPHLGPCWLWTERLRYGYGTFTIGMRRMMAHTYAYNLLIGDVSDGLELDHLCHTLSKGTCCRGDACPHRRCVNPAHLEPVTSAENTRRIMDAQTHCGKGHLFDEANTRWYRGHRRCRACDREDARAKRPPAKPPMADEDKRRIALTVKLSEADVALIDAASGGRQRGAWIREAALAAARRGMATPPGRPAWGSVGCRVVVHPHLTEDEAALIDAARGGTPRSTWMRAAALMAAA